jgi:hypothetical protein
MLDLFGEVVITLDDIETWVAAVAPAFMSSEHAFLHYVHAWDVADKVRRAKLDGTFDSTIEQACAQRASWHRRLGLHL